MIIEYEPNLDLVFIHFAKGESVTDVLDVGKSIVNATNYEKKHVIFVREGQPNPFNSSAIIKLHDYMSFHEGDIADGINDFGELSGIFETLFNRKPINEE